MLLHLSNIKEIQSFSICAYCVFTANFDEKNMKRYLFITALFFQAVLTVKGQTVTDSIDHFLIAKMKKTGIPGLQLAVVRNGVIVKTGSYGLANLQDSVPVTSKTIFQLNSITKAFVGVAVMQLVEAGKLDLSKPVSFYLDSLPPAWRAVTIRQLLTHSSGLPKILDNNTGKLVGETDSAAWANVKTMAPEFKPGEKFSYNQTNYVLIGKIINKLTAGDFTQFIKEKQLDVVKLPDTRFFDSHEVVSHAASIYTYSTFVNDVRYRTSEPQNVFYEFSPFIRTTVGLNSTATEMARWIIALQQGVLLKNKNSLAALWAPGILNNGQTAGFSRMFNGYAIGWPAIIRPEHRAMAPIGAGCSAVFVYPDDNLSVIILTNLQGANPEEFADEVAGFYIPGMRASDGFGLPPAIRSFRAVLVKKGFDQAIPAFKDQQSKTKDYRLDENEVDIWGWTLVNQDHIKEALEIFKLNIYLYPKSSAAYDSYGGELEAIGKTTEAINLFKQALQLNPKDDYAIGHLRHLGAME